MLGLRVASAGIEITESPDINPEKVL
jgi:hypothetical protein